MDTLSIICLNFAYATGGSLVALSFTYLGYKLFDRLTPFDTATQLKDGNVAVGMSVAAIFLSVGLVVGLVVSSALN